MSVEVKLSITLQEKARTGEKYEQQIIVLFPTPQASVWGPAGIQCLARGRVSTGTCRPRDALLLKNNLLLHHAAQNIAIIPVETRIFNTNTLLLVISTLFAISK